MGYCTPIVVARSYIGMLEVAPGASRWHHNDLVEMKYGN